MKTKLHIPIFSGRWPSHTACKDMLCAKFWCSVQLPCMESVTGNKPCTFYSSDFISTALRWQFHKHFRHEKASIPVTACLQKNFYVAEWWTGCRNRARLKRMLFILQLTFSLGPSVCLSSIKAPQLHEEMSMEPRPTLILCEWCSNQMM